MELKKNPRADLRRYAGLFFEVGLVVALSAVLASFNYTKHELNRMVFSGIDNIDFEDVLIPVTHPKEIAPSDLEEDFEIEDVEATQETAVASIDRPDEVEDTEEDIFITCEFPPSFPGGVEALYKFISDNVKYPSAAKDNNVTGKVVVRFVVNQKGNIENAYVFRSIDPLLDREAIRVVESLPKWNPGTQRGKPVKVWFTLPINFQLN